MAKKKDVAVDIDLIMRVRDDHKDANKATSGWRSQAQESYKFVPGGRGQWDDEDIITLEEAERPVITFNRIGPYVDAVSGNEINTRHTIAYLPRTLDDLKKTEIYTAAVRWVRDNCNAEDEESDGFVDTLICGMGWIETNIQYDEEPDGKICLNRVDPMQMRWDPAAKKRNLEDRRWCSRTELLSKEEVTDKWPDADLSGASLGGVEDPEESGTAPHNASLAFLYKNNATGYDDSSKKYRIVHYQWFELDTVYRVENPATGKEVELSPTKWEKLKDSIGAAKWVKQRRRVYKQAFLCGDKILEKSDLRCKGFTFKPITGKRNKVDNTWYGLVENMKDPQRWANKFFSQILHIVNSNAKGGLMAETGAFVDPKKAEEQWADPNAVILLKNGGLQKVKERQAAQFPQALDRLMTFAVTSIPSTAGINLETLGLATGDQAGILEQERKKSTFTVLAPFFDSLRRYRKEEGRLLFHFVNEYIPDGTLIKIENEQGQQWVPFVRSDDTLKFDIIVDESPTSPNQKQEVWATMEKLIPSMLKEGLSLPADFFKYSPLPSELADKMTESLKNRVPPELAKKMQEMGAELQKLGQENQQLKQDASLEAAKIQSKDQQAHVKAMLSDAQMKTDYQVNLQTIQSKNEQQMQKLVSQLEAQDRQLAHERAQDALNAQLEAGNAQMKRRELAFKEWETKVKAGTAITVAEIGAEAKPDGAETGDSSTGGESKKETTLDDILAQVNASIGELLAPHIEALHQKLDDMRPVGGKKVFGANGEMVGADVTYASGSTRHVPMVH